MTVRHLLFVTLLGVVLVLSACSNESIDDTAWTVDAIQRVDGSFGAPLPGTVLSVDFSTDGITSGLAGCNSFTGPYTTDGSSFSAGPLATTLKLCDPQPIMAQESNYLGLLAAADGFELTGDSLVLMQGSERTIEMSLQEPLSLEDTSWNLIFYNNQAEALVSVIQGTEITMSLDAANASGSAGCNAWNATYEAGGSDIQFGPTSSTRMTCPTPIGIMEQESLFLADIGFAVSYRVNDEGNLDMFDEDGTRLLSFAPAR